MKSKIWLIIKIDFFLGLAVGLYLFVWYKTPEQRAFEKTLSAAQAGQPGAAFEAAQAYAQGLGVEANGPQAAEWYRKAAAEGDMQAAWQLAELYRKGTLLPQDPEEALVYIQLAAEGKNARAQRELAHFYAQGQAGLTAQEGQALYWYLQAAAQGDQKAQTAVQAIEQKNPALYEKVVHFQEVLNRAQQGDAAARLEAGQGLVQGEVLAQNYEEALRFFTLAWQESQSPQAAYELARLYQQGFGTEKDENKAIALYGAAAQAGNADAQYTLGTLAYGAKEPNYTDAFAWFSNAAANRHPQAQYMTGFMLMQGQGTNPSVPLAIKFFRDAAEQNHVSAQYVLGQIYWKGLGVPADKKAGEEWLKRAAQGGNAAAQALLEQK